MNLFGTKNIQMFFEVDIHSETMNILQPTTVLIKR